MSGNDATTRDDAAALDAERQALAAAVATVDAVDVGDLPPEMPDEEWR